MSHSFDSLVLLTSIPSETSILSKYINAFIIYKHSFKNIVYLIYLYTNLFLKIHYSIIVVVIFILINNWLTGLYIITLWKVNIFSVGKELYESILILAKLWIILTVIPLFSFRRYLILSQILPNKLWSNITKHLILLNSSI